MLKNVRAGIMPPAGKPRPSSKEQRILEDWIKYAAFGIDPNDPDPGRVTVRRLNRVEYRNTVRDLLDVVYDTSAEFPPDDSGHGFDNIGDVLTMSPLLLEKYIAAADFIVSKAVPTTSTSRRGEDASRPLLSPSRGRGRGRREHLGAALPLLLRCSVGFVLLHRPNMPADTGWSWTCRRRNDSSTAFSITTSAGSSSRWMDRSCSGENSAGRKGDPIAMSWTGTGRPARIN